MQDTVSISLTGRNIKKIKVYTDIWSTEQDCEQSITVTVPLISGHLKHKPILDTAISIEHQGSDNGDQFVWITDIKIGSLSIFDLVSSVELKVNTVNKVTNRSLGNWVDGIGVPDRFTFVIPDDIYVKIINTWFSLRPRLKNPL